MIDNFKIFYEDKDFKMTKEQAYETIVINKALGLTGELNEKNFAMMDGDDIIMKIDSEEFGKALEIIIKENSRHDGFNITYEGSEEYAEVVGDYIDELIVSYAEMVETVRIKGLRLSVEIEREYLNR